MSTGGLSVPINQDRTGNFGKGGLQDDTGIARDRDVELDGIESLSPVGKLQGGAQGNLFSRGGGISIEPLVQRVEVTEIPLIVDNHGAQHADVEGGLLRGAPAVDRSGRNLSRADRVFRRPGSEKGGLDEEASPARGHAEGNPTSQADFGGDVLSLAQVDHIPAIFLILFSLENEVAGAFFLIENSQCVDLVLVGTEDTCLLSKKLGA